MIWKNRRLAESLQVLKRPTWWPVDPPEMLPDVQNRDILRTVAPYTMVHPSGVHFLVNQTVRLIEAGIPGAFVECGSWKGGCSMAMLLAQRAAYGEVKRPVYILDSFQGLPPTGERDGPLAAAWQQGAQPEKFFDNCRAAESELRGALAGMGFGPADYRVLPGWFKDTLPGLQADLKASGIALLRLDGDWYDSTLLCLEKLAPLVAEDGCVIIDDYYAWDGCARAVHDYLSRNDLCYRIKSLPGNYGAYFMKRSHRRNFDEF